MWKVDTERNAINSEGSRDCSKDGKSSSKHNGRDFKSNGGWNGLYRKRKKKKSAHKYSFAASRPSCSTTTWSSSSSRWMEFSREFWVAIWHQTPFLLCFPFRRIHEVSWVRSQVLVHIPPLAWPPVFCKETLCLEPVIQFLDVNFVCWGGLADRGEG